MAEPMTAGGLALTQLVVVTPGYGRTGGYGIDGAEARDASHECPRCLRLILVEGCVCGGVSAA